MPNLSSFPRFTLFVLLFIAFQISQSAPLSKVQIDYFIDPATSSPNQNGGKFQPFKTFSQAFQTLKEQVQRFNSTEILATFYCKEDSLLIFAQDEDFLLNLENNSLLKLSVKAYGLQGIDVSKLKPLIFEVKGRLSFNLPSTKLILEGIIFRFNLNKEKEKFQELILFEGENSEVIMTKCEFKAINLTSLENLETVFRIKGERMLIKRSKFEDVILPGNLFQVKDRLDTIIKFELNELRNITIQSSGALVSAEKAYSVSFLSNNATQTNGRLVSAVDCEGAIVYQNNFTGIAGEYPIYVKSIESAVFSFNNVSGNISQKSQGIGLFINIQILRLENMTLEGYISDTPALYFLYNETRVSSMKPYVVIEKLYMVNNVLLPGTANALVKGESLGMIPVSISFENLFFKNNTARKAEHGIGSSTIWIEATGSEVKISKGTFANNIAGDGSCNLYINTSKISINRALFYNNTQVSINPAFSNINLLATSLIVIHGSDFRRNIGVYGGGLSAILKEKNAKIRLERSNFLENKAEIGGGFYVETSQEEQVDVMLESVFFEKNQAVEGVNYNSDLKVQNLNRNKEIIMKTFLWENQTEKVYRSGELKIKNALPSDLFFGPISFEVKGDGGNQTYMVSMNVVPSDYTRKYWPRMKQGFQNREVEGGEFSLDSMTFKEQDRGRMNKVELIMETADSRESYFFVIFLEADLLEPSCERGEMYVFSRNACFSCPRNTYGLSPFLSACKKCPVGANCTEGGYKLELLPGYWRDLSQDENVEIHHCGDNHKKCLGGLYSTCAEGYAGVLCTACDLKGGYRRKIKGYCEKCGDNILGDIGMVVLPVGFMVYSLWIVLGGEEIRVKKSPENREKVKLSLLVNLWNNFVRGVFVMNSLGLNLPEILSYFIQTFTNSTLPLVNSLACYLDDPINTSLFWYLSMYLAVFIMKCFIALVILKSLNVSFENSKGIIVTWMIYQESLGILDVLLSMVSCSKLPQSRFLKFDLLRECPSNFEISQTVGFILIIGVLFIFPMASLEMLEGDVKSPRVQRLQAMMFGRSGEFVKNEYETGFFYYSEAYQHLFLLVLSSLEMIFSTKLLILMAYYTLIMLFNEHRRILFFHDKKAGLFLVEKYVMAVLSAFALIASYLYMNILHSWCYYLGLLIIIGYGGFLVGLIVHNCYYSVKILENIFGVSWMELADSKKKEGELESIQEEPNEEDDENKAEELSGLRSRTGFEFRSEQNVRTSIRHDDDSD